MTELPPLSPNAWLRWAVVSKLLPPEARDVLEVGCGQGGFGARLATRYRYVGVDMDEVSARVASTRLEALGDAASGEIRTGDLSVLAPDEQFDLVCAFEVIEHIEDDRGALQSWADRIRPGGWLLLSTPAHQHRFGPADEMAGHFRRYEPDALAHLLTEVGLSEPQVTHFGMPLGYALEAGRNAVGRRRNARLRDADMNTRTHGSGRLLQPSGRGAGTVTQLGTLPFRVVQRAFPGRGPGLVARARKPSGA
ncbi:MAG: class I SAM-dependent methyltransferase [Sporichthyaceae bacterium]